jgi:hypothetical protein
MKEVKKLTVDPVPEMCRQQGINRLAINDDNPPRSNSSSAYPPYQRNKLVLFATVIDQQIFGFASLFVI